MKVIHFKDADSYEPEKHWKRVSLCNENDISVEHFVKPPHHASPRHNHSNSQVLVVLKGELKIITDEKESLLKEGDSVYIPGNEFHVISNPMDKVSEGLDIFIPGRSFDFWSKRG